MASHVADLQGVLCRAPTTRHGRLPAKPAVTLPVRDNRSRCWQERVSGRRGTLACWAADRQGSDDNFETDMLMRDMERMKQRQASNSASGPSSPEREIPGQPQSGGALDGAKNVLDKVLIADFFFVCVALLWLGLGVAEKATVKSSTLADAWLPLWPLVFQPAIGVLMLGAILSGVVGWLERQQSG